VIESSIGKAKQGRRRVAKGLITIAEPATPDAGDRSANEQQKAVVRARM